MPRKVKLFSAGLLLAVVGIACVAMAGKSAHAEETNSEQSGNGWNISADGVMTIESNQGWANCLKAGFEDNVRELIIGKELTNFRMYDLPFDVPAEDFFNREDILAHDKFGNPIYDFTQIDSIYPSKIVVADGNPVFRVVDGLLINSVTNELVLSEMGVSDVVIPEGIKTITKGAFLRRPLISVRFPSSLESIGENAFLKCEKLTTVELPDSIRKLSEGAFSMCSNLEHVALSHNLNVIGKYAFDSCLIQQIEIPSNVKEIGEWAFSRCEQLKLVNLTAGIQTIARSAFSNCKQLQSINFPEGLTTIGEAAFSGCYNLKRVALPNSLELIGHKSFWGCDLAVLRIPAKLTFLVYDAYHWEYIVNSHTKRDKSFELSSADTVIFSGSDYDFGYPAINDAKNVYFLGLPPEDVGQILDRETTGNIYCPEEYKFEWTRSSIASWVRQKIQFLPSDQLKEITDQEINATPIPTNTPSPTPRPTETPWPTPMPRPTASPAVTAKLQQQGTDPLVFAFAGILALVIAGIVVVAVKSRPNNRKRRRKHV